MGKRRLDTLLAERGLYESRSRAAAAVIAGDVSVAGRPASKPGELVPDEADVAVAETPPYVSRGGVKLAKVLPAVVRAAAPSFDLLAMVKPQFEVGRERVGKGGVVRSPDHRRAALIEVGEFARAELGLPVLGYAPSGLPGPAGNRETFVWLAEPGRAGGVDDLEAAARRAEP